MNWIHWNGTTDLYSGRMPCEEDEVVTVKLHGKPGWYRGKAWCYMWGVSKQHRVLEYSIMTKTAPLIINAAELKRMITPEPKTFWRQREAMRYCGLCTALMADKETQSKFLKTLESVIDLNNLTRQSIDAAFDAAIAAMEKT